MDVLRGLPDSPGNAHGNAMPTTMMSILGINTQGIRATATAQVAAGNAVRCIKPWVVADRWTDNRRQRHTARGWISRTSSTLASIPTPPRLKATAGNDLGLELVLKRQWEPGALGGRRDRFERALAATLRAEIAGCPGYVPTVGLYDPPIPCAEGQTPTPRKAVSASRRA